MFNTLAFIFKPFNDLTAAVTAKNPPKKFAVLTTYTCAPWSRAQSPLAQATVYTSQWSCFWDAYA